MNIQQMMMQAQKLQREMQKKKDALAEKEFVISKGGAVTVTVLGSKHIKSIEVDNDAFDPDNKSLVEEMIALAINEAISQIEQEEENINQALAGGANLGF